MKIIVKAKTNAKVESVEKLPVDLNMYKVSVTESPVDGKANRAIIKALAKHFKTSQSCIRLVIGQTSKTKAFEILI